MESPHVPDAVPGNIRSLIEEVGFPDISSLNLPPEQEAVLNLGREGRCMTCHGEVGEDTVLILNRYGIVAVHCGGACMTDHHVLGWMQEVFDDITDTVKFRSGVGDKADEDEAQAE